MVSKLLQVWGSSRRRQCMRLASGNFCPWCPRCPRCSWWPCYPSPWSTWISCKDIPWCLRCEWAAAGVNGGGIAMLENGLRCFLSFFSFSSLMTLLSKSLINLDFLRSCKDIPEVWVSSRCPRRRRRQCLRLASGLRRHFHRRSLPPSQSPHTATQPRHPCLTYSRDTRHTYLLFLILVMPLKYWSRKEYGNNL